MIVRQAAASAAAGMSAIASVLVLLFMLVLAPAPGLVAADADFESVRTGLMKDHSGKPGDPAQKFFHESTFHPHYDGRFADKTIPEDKRRPHLVAMTRAYLSTMADLGAETWIMHGTLMGWWWNRKIMPWDSDIDAQLTLDTLSFLYNFYQLYVFHFEVGEIDSEGEEDEETGSKDYMLEINPDYNRETNFDDLNSIDARWIDMTTGMFIDLTAVRPNETARALGHEGALKCKDRHKYNESDIFPLRDSTFEGVPAKIPYEYAWLLEEEYGAESLTKTDFEKHRFNQTNMEWEKIPDAEGDGARRGYRRPRPGARSG